MTDRTSPAGEDDSGWEGQFRQPTGFAGLLAGWIMAFQNRSLNRAAVRRLNAGPDDDVLEIGFGPGLAIAHLARHSAPRFIAGIDPSAVMVKQALATNRNAVSSGRVAFVQATVEQLPFKDRRFSRVFVVSTFHDWQSRRQGLSEIHRVLRPEGRFVMCLRRAPRWRFPWSSPGLTSQELRDDIALIQKQGFADVRLVSGHYQPRLVCIIAQA